MNRRQLERHLREHDCVLHHHGAKHDVWVNPRSLAQASVPRPLPLEGPRGQAAPPLAPGACLVQSRRTGQDALEGGVACPSRLPLIPSVPYRRR